VYSAQAAIEPGTRNIQSCGTNQAAIQVTQTPPQLGFDLFRNWRF
jgi:hypothetical protein